MPRPHADLIAAARPYFAGEKETFATVLLGALMQTHGAAVLEWDPATVEAQVSDDFGVQMPELVYDQLMALVTCMSTDTVYTSVPVFDRTVSALNRAGADDQLGIPTPEEVAWAVFEILGNDPDPYGEGKKASWPFSPDIGRYVGVVLQDAGLRKAPETLAFARMPDWNPSSGNPEEFAAADQGQGDLSDQVDQHIARLFQEMARQLAELGLSPAEAMLEESENLPEESPIDRLFAR